MLFYVEKKINVLFFLLLLIFSFTSQLAFSVDLNNKKFLFLQSINDLSADYKQTQFDGKNNIITYGKIAIKKPDNVMLTYADKNMRLKIVSIGGNMKVIDEDLGQTTYVDSRYSELMQFFTKNLQAEKLSMDTHGNLCMKFRHFDNDMEACLEIDVNKQMLIRLMVFVEDADYVKSGKKIREKYPVMKIDFLNVKINKGVSNEVFVIKDNRIFNDDEDF